MCTEGSGGFCGKLCGPSAGDRVPGEDDAANNSWRDRKAGHVENYVEVVEVGTAGVSVEVFVEACANSLYRLLSRALCLESPRQDSGKTFRRRR